MRLPFGIFLSLAFSSAVVASDPMLPDGEGIAAIDIKTGEWLWQAWTVDDVPEEFRQFAKKSSYSLLGDGVSLTYEEPIKDEHDLLIQHRWTEESPAKLELAIWEGQKLLAAADVNARRSIEKTDVGWFVVNGEGHIDFYERAKPSDPAGWGRRILDDWQLPKNRSTIAAQVDGDRIWIANADRLIAWNPKSNQQLLSVPVTGLSDFGWSELIDFEISVLGDLLALQNKRQIVALDRNSGEQLWQTEHFQFHEGPRPFRPPNREDVVLIEINSGLSDAASAMMRPSTDGGLAYMQTPPVVQAVAAAEMARAMGDGCQRLNLKRRIEAEQLPKAAIPILEKILDEEWPAEMSAKRLEQFCIDQLTKSNLNNPFPREAAWVALQSQFLLYPRTDGSLQAKPDLNFVELGILSFKDAPPELVDECRQTLKDGDAHEQGYAACLVSAHAANTGDKSHLQELIVHPSADVWPWAAAYGAILKERTRLVEGLQQRPKSDRLDSLTWLRAVASESVWDGKLHDLADAEVGIIVEALEERSFDAGRRFGFLFNIEDNAKDLAAYKPLLEQARKIVRAEAEAPAFRFSDSDGMENLIALISAAADPADNFILDTLLLHPHVEFRANAKTQTMLCRFPIRQAAAEILIERGVELPANFAAEIEMPERKP